MKDSNRQRNMTCSWTGKIQADREAQHRHDIEDSGGYRYNPLYKPKSQQMFVWTQSDSGFSVGK